jgi:regulator of sirC expression with transglutaminase-like and TPR domain
MSNEDLKSTNATLVQKLETAMQKLVSQRESESKLRDTYEQELKAQAHLAQIYKGWFSNSSSSVLFCKVLCNNVDIGICYS